MLKLGSACLKIGYYNSGIQVQMQSSMSMAKGGAYGETESQNPFDLNDFPPLDELDPSLCKHP